MPDKWEYPWYAAWDLAFHCIPLTLVDPDFAKRQLELMTREWYMHPNGQLPAYEWSFGDHETQAQTPRPRRPSSRKVAYVRCPSHLNTLYRIGISSVTRELHLRAAPVSGAGQSEPNGCI